MTSSTSVSLSFLNGLGMSRSSRIVFPSTVTTNAPFRGFSAFTETLYPAASSTFTALAARVLNTPQLLQCSIPASPLVQCSMFALTFEVLAGDAFFGAAVLAAFLVLVVDADAFPMTPRVVKANFIPEYRRILPNYRKCNDSS